MEAIVMAKELAKQNHLGFKLFFLERKAQGVVDVRMLDSVNLDVVKELGLDPRFLYVI